MFCPKCGQQNPENGKFCRSCGTDLGNVSQALTGNIPQQAPLVDRRGRPVSWDRAITKIFTGIAFLAVAIAISFSIGKAWWFWLLIPAFGSIGHGVAQLVQLKKSEKGGMMISPSISVQSVGPAPANSLPPQQAGDWASGDSRYKTGDLVPPSVTDSTTRKLEIDGEGQTMTLPKN